MIRWILISVLALGSATLCAEAPPASLGKKAAPFMLADPRDQAKVVLTELKDKKAVVVVFLGTECPVNNLYLTRLAELNKEFEGKEVQFLGINSNAQDGLERVANHAKKHGLPFPVLKDVGNAVADAFGAKRTPEAFVLDGQHVIRYQGRIDDQYGIDLQRPKPTRRDLAEAIEEVLAGKEVSVAATSAAGCLIGRAPKPKADGAVTFARHVAPILQKHCQECHRPGQIGPMALLSYADAAPWAETIREQVADRRMPPWHADPQFGKFSNDRRLPDEARDTLLKWVDLGCPEGDKGDLPPAKEWPEGWRIGKPDLIVSLPNDYDVPARGTVPYRHFTVDPGFTEDKWVWRAEARPGSPAVVHHILVFVVPPGQRFFAENPTNIVLCGTAPGDMPTMLPKGMAKKVPAGAKLVFQMHYTPNGTAQKDRSSIGLIFADGPQQEVRTIPVYNAFFRIPPGADNQQVESTYTFRQDGKVISFMPHMHLRGKDFKVEKVDADGGRETQLWVPRFNFNWQQSYRLADPLAMPKGSRIHCTAHFDNSANNPNNPDPTKAIYWGDQTWQEMMVGWMDVVFDAAKKE